jgi:hypothetical protein
LRSISAQHTCLPSAALGLLQEKQKEADGPQLQPEFHRLPVRTRVPISLSLSLVHSICPPPSLSVGVSSFLSWQGAWFGCVRGRGTNSLVRAGVGGVATSACACWANPVRVLSWIKRAVRVPELCSRQTRTDAHMCVCVCVCVCTPCTHCVNRGQ